MHQLAGEMAKLAALVLPILLTQVAQTSMGFVDTLISGRAGTLDLAAVALGSAFWMPTIVFGQGILLAVMPQVSRLHGQHGLAGRNVRTDDVGHEVRQGIWLALALAVPLVGVIIALTRLMPLLGYEAALTDMACRYLLACVWGLPGYLLFVALRCGTDGLGRVRTAMLTAFVGLGLNIVGNIGFVLGKWGLPAYGGVGAGIATAIVCWCMPAMMLLQCLRMPDMRRWLSLSAWTGPKLATVWRTAAVGLPGATATLCEITMFSAVAVIIGVLGPMALASNQIAGSFSGMVFMLPLSLGIAVTIRTGRSIGEGSAEGARLSARAGVCMGLCIAALTATGILLFRHKIPYLFNDDPIVAAAAVGLLTVTAWYQFPDAVQVIVAGALRAYDDTRAIFLLALLTYWGVGLPLGYVLGMTHYLVPAMGARGFWIAITVGLSLASVLFSLRLLRKERRFAENGGKVR